MSGNLETKLRERLQGQELQAPDLMSSIYQKRTAWYVFMNRVRLNKGKLAAAASVLIAVVAILVQFNSNEPSHVANEVTPEVTAPESIVQNNQDVTDAPAQSLDAAEAIPSEPNEVSNEETNVESNNTDIQTPHQQELYNTVTQGQAYQTNQSLQDEPKQDMTSSQNLEIVEASGGEEVPHHVEQSEEDVHYDSEEYVVSESLSDEESVLDDEGIDRPEVVEIRDADDDEMVLEVEEQQAQTQDDQADNVIAQEEIVEAPNEEEQVEDGGNTGGDDFVPTQRPRKWAVGLSYGAGIGARGIGSSTEGDAVANRNNSERQQFSNSVDLSVYFRLNPNVELVGGLNYFGRREALQYTKTTDIEKMNVASKEVIEIHPIYGERKVTVFDTTYTTETTSEDIKKNNLYHHIMVPVGVRYTEQFRNAPKWSFSMQAQYGLEVVTQLNATVLDGLNQEVSLGGQERTGIGHAVSAGGAFNFHANNRLTVLFEPRATLYLTPMMRSTYRIEQTDRAFVGYIGFKYTL